MPSRPQLGSAGRTPCEAPLGAGDGVAAPRRLFPPRPERDVPAGRQQGVGAPDASPQAWTRLEDGPATWSSAPNGGCAPDRAELGVGLIVAVELPGLLLKLLSKASPLPFCVCVCGGGGGLTATKHGNV